MFINSVTVEAFTMLFLVTYSSSEIHFFKAKVLDTDFQQLRLPLPTSSLNFGLPCLIKSPAQSETPTPKASWALDPMIHGVRVSSKGQCYTDGFSPRLSMLLHRFSFASTHVIDINPFWRTILEFLFRTVKLRVFWLKSKFML